MHIINKLIRVLAGLMVISFMIIACSSGGGGGSSESTGYIIGTLPNGSTVYAETSTFSAKSNESTTGHIALVGGTPGAEYLLFVYNVEPTGPEVRMLDRTYCLVVAGDVESSVCEIVFNGNNSESGTYFVSIGYAPNANLPATNVNPNAIGESLANPLQFVVTQGDEQPLLIFATSELTNGVLGGVAGADSKCQEAAAAKDLTATFKAMLIGEDEPLPRRACSTANCAGDGELGGSDWVLLPNQLYVNEDGQNIGITNDNAIFTFPVDNVISSGSNKVWTGLAKDWTNQANCVNWTTTTINAHSANGFIGQENAISDDMISDSLGQACTNDAVLYCVEQE